MKQHWFKAELQFLCPSCRKVSAETILARASDQNTVAVAIVERVPIECQLCKATFAEPVRIKMLMSYLTPEDLANLQMGSSPSQLAM
jgi:hypothetical protein